MSASGNFFAVDRRVWSDLCDLGKVNLAAAYLVLARGTLRDLRTVSWSVNAIEKRTGIPRLKAKAAIQALVQEGFVERRRDSTRPQYFLRTVEAVREQRASKRDLTPKQAALLDVIRAHPEGITPPDKGAPGVGWPAGIPAATAIGLFAAKLVRKLSSGAIVAVEEPELAADWIWLPNSIVDGADGEMPPLERVREALSPAALRLFVNLYHAQGLSIDGGVNWREIRKNYHRQKVGERGEFDIYGFWPVEPPKNVTAWPDAAFVAAHMTGRKEAIPLDDGSYRFVDMGWGDFWEAMRVLIDAGVAAFVPHLVTGDTDEGTVVHPLARDDEGEEAEREVATAAHVAALAMLRAVGKVPAYSDQVRLVPVRRHVGHVSVVGLLRLRYRANTSATAAWFERMDEWRSWAERYRAHQVAAGGGPKAAPDLATSTGHQREINGTSTGDQR